MTSWLGACILLVGFVGVIKLAGLVANSSRIVALAHDSWSVLRDPELDDLHKEKALQANSLALFRLFFVVLATTIAALGIPLGLIWLLDRSGAMVLDEVLDTTLSWQFLLLGTLLGVAAGWFLRRSK